MKKYYFFIFLFVFLFPALVFAEDLQLASGQTINITITSPVVTYTITSSTGIDSLSVNGTDITLTLSSGDSVTITNSSGYLIPNSLGQATLCDGANASSITFTATATITASAEALCRTGGGGGGSAPYSTSIKINSGASETTNRNVILTLFAGDATQMVLSHSLNFENASREPYVTTKNWVLTEGDGEKRVYVKYRSSGIESSAISAVIILKESKETPSTPSLSPTPAEQTPVPLVSLTEGMLVKHPGKSSVYLIQGGKIRPYLNERIFLAYGNKFSNVVEGDLSSYTVGDLIGIFPDSYDFTCGQLVKATSEKVYIVSKCEEGQKKELMWIINEEVFNKAGWKFSNLNLISDAKKAEFTEGQQFESLSTHPAGSLIQYMNNSKVYLLRTIDGFVKKSWITDENEFNRRKFQWSDVVTIPDTEFYSDAQNISGTVLGVEYEEVFVSFLSLGSSGEEVRKLQEKLQELGFFPADLSPTGYFGPTTERAVRDFQAAHNIEAVGLVGPKTREVLNSL